MFTLYPRRTLLCFSLFVGQAFLYNAFFFTYGDTLTTFFDVKQTGYYIAVFALSNFAGALLLAPAVRPGRPGADDRRAPTSSPGCCSRSAGVVLGDLDAVSLTVFGAVIFFFASAGASAAYLTASEIFPMETRALCIAFFYAIGTAAGGIAGPLLFGKLIDNASADKDITAIAIGYFIGAALMIAGGLVEAVFGVKAEGESLENIAKPLTAEDGDRRRGPSLARSGSDQAAHCQQAEHAQGHLCRHPVLRLVLDVPVPLVDHGRKGRPAEEQLARLVAVREARAEHARDHARTPRPGCSGREVAEHGQPHQSVDDRHSQERLLVLGAPVGERVHGDVGDEPQTEGRGRRAAERAHGGAGDDVVGDQHDP